MARMASVSCVRRPLVDAPVVGQHVQQGAEPAVRFRPLVDGPAVGQPVDGPAVGQRRSKKGIIVGSVAYSKPGLSSKIQVQRKSSISPA